jgi:hypothetical protein
MEHWIFYFLDFYVSELCGQTKPKIIIMMEQMKKKKLKGLNKTFLFCDKAERKKKKKVQKQW